MEIPVELGECSHDLCSLVEERSQFMVREGAGPVGVGACEFGLSC